MRRSRVLRTSSFRLALMYAGLTGLSSLVLFGVIFWSTARFMRHQIDDSVSSEIDEIRTDSQAGSAAGLELLVQGLARHSSGFYYLLQDPAGVARAGNLPALDPVVGIREWAKAADSARLPYSAMRGRGVLIGGDYVFVGWSTHQLYEMEHMVIGSFVWGLTACIALALAGGIVAGSRLMRRIETVSETSRDIVEGDLTRRVPVTPAGDELDNLAGSVNAMLDRIQTLMNDLRQVTTDIAHDMRTPLTRLRQRLERAQRSQAGAGELREAVGAAVREIDVLLRVFGALLRIAQIESGARKSGFTQVALSDLLATVVELYRPAAEEKEQTFEADLEQHLALNGDHELLMQLFANLVENAIRHSTPRARIQLSARQEGKGVAVVVSDNGPGVPADMRTKVVQRFFRLESSRTTPGNGLGLSLANAVVKLHEATMSLQDNQPGLRVTVSFANR